MKLKAYINGNEYNLVQGAEFSEEYNETLDSGTIIIDQVQKIKSLNPYDDVYVYSYGNGEPDFDGYTNSNRQTLTFDYEVVDTENRIRILRSELRNIYTKTVLSQSIEFVYVLEDETIIRNTNAYFTYNSNADTFTMSLPNLGYTYTLTRESSTSRYYTFNYSDHFDVAFFGFCNISTSLNSVEKPSFYKHLLIYQFTEERINPSKNLYKYKILLCSETKKLETIQLPNVSVTQPLDISLKKSVYDYIFQFVDMYNPRVKISTSNYTYQWMYKNKYTLSNDLYEIFGNVYCPDFSLDNPSLKDVLHQLMLTKDRIPYVKDDVIYAMDITQRMGTFNTDNIFYISGSKSIENYADNLKRTYSNALSGKNTARRVEYLGFRNSSQSLMTLGNMRVETKYPIYKINKIYMCYYKKSNIFKDGEPTRDMVFLCKQDITDLVKLEQERGLLSEDWDDFNNNVPEGSDVIQEMAQYKLCTVGYSIGSNLIEGWGTKYTYPQGWWNVSVTYLENIFKIIDKNIPYGIYTYGYISKNLNEGEVINIDQSVDPFDNLVTPFGTSDTFGDSLKLKSFFFIVDYEAFYNGTLVTSKDNNRDDIVMNDNSSSSLTLLEKDGLFQKEKANRFGNMGYTLRANYDNISSLQELGSVYDDDVIIYSRSYSIWDNLIRASYMGTKDYVLKNYYTSVFSRHRPYALMDYNQSVTRAENKKNYILLSKDTLYFEDRGNLSQNFDLNFNSFTDNDSYMDDIISFAKPSKQATAIDRFEFPDKINYGYIKYNGNKYSSDINTFISGYSLCFNISMWDNISMGQYIKNASPSMGSIISGYEDDFTGSVQDFYSVIDNNQTGFTESMGFYVSHIPPSEDFNDVVQESYAGIENDLYEKIFALPKIASSIEEKDIIGKEYTINKDNKEVIDMTFQIEAYTNSEDVVFSEWMLKLSDLNGNYHKVNQNYRVRDVTGYSATLDIYYSTFNLLAGGGTYDWGAVVVIKIPISIFNNLSVGTPVNAEHSWSDDHYAPYPGGSDSWFNWYMTGFTMKLVRITSLSDDRIGINADVVYKWRHGLAGGSSTESKSLSLYFTKVDRLADIDFTQDAENYYFTNTQTFDNYFYYFSGSNFPIGRYADDNHIIGKYTNSLETQAFGKFDMLLSDLSGTSKIYTKNMFIRLSEEELSKTLVYDEYSEGSLVLSDLNVASVITNDVEEVATNITKEFVNILKVDLTNVATTTKSVQMWFLDNGILHFVFGVNVTEEDFANGYVKIYISSVSKRDTRVYGTNHLVVGEIKNYAEDDTENEYGKRQYYVVE